MIGKFQIFHSHIPNFMAQIQIPNLSPKSLSQTQRSSNKIPVFLHNMNMNDDLYNREGN